MERIKYKTRNKFLFSLLLLSGTAFSTHLYLLRNRPEISKNYYIDYFFKSNPSVFGNYFLKHVLYFL
jgi:hypothetical protein